MFNRAPVALPAFFFRKRHNDGKQGFMERERVHVIIRRTSTRDIHLGTPGANQGQLHRIVDFMVVGCHPQTRSIRCIVPVRRVPLPATDAQSVPLTVTRTNSPREEWVLHRVPRGYSGLRPRGGIACATNLGYEFEVMIQCRSGEKNEEGQRDVLENVGVRRFKIPRKIENRAAMHGGWVEPL